MPARLDGKVCVITGGTQGIGEAAARLFASQGAKAIVVSGRSADRGEALAAAISDSGTPTSFAAGELASVDDCRRVVATAVELHGRVDVLVNAGGSTDRGTVANTTPDSWDMLFDVNVRAPFFLLQAAADDMRRRGATGSVVNVVSQVAHVGWPDLIGYAASKGALANLTRTTAVALAGDGIRVNGLLIGWSNTPGEHAIRQRFYGDSDGSWLEEAGRSQPRGRLLEPDEIALAIAFLASDESGLMTGSLVDYDQTVFGLAANPAG